MAKYLVTLTDEELAQVLALTHKGRIAARRLMRAHILRLAHEQQIDEVIAHTLQTSVATVERIRERFVLGGVDYALAEEPRVGAPCKLDGKQEAFLVALACSTPPEGHRDHPQGQTPSPLHRSRTCRRTTPSRRPSVVPAGGLAPSP